MTAWDAVNYTLLAAGLVRRYRFFFGSART